jgi:Histidine kinase-, DNA gyrase B-, and HSP90-like ATPase
MSHELESSWLQPEEHVNYLPLLVQGCFIVKINQTPTPTIDNIDAAIDFGIDTESMAFIIQMLSSKLYEDPLMAMVRETVTNAIDANNSAGKRDIPIGIMSNLQAGELMFTVADSGNGMDPDCIKNVFTKLGKSSKSDDNANHGGYGLGILSVFAVASQATIETVAGGIHYSYLMFINTAGIPSLTLLAQRPSVSFEVGTKVSVPIDLETFDESELEQAIGWFAATVDPAPLTSIELPDLKSFAGHAWELKQAPYDTDEPDWDISLCNVRLAVRIGQISYQLTYELIEKLIKLVPYGVANSQMIAKILGHAAQNSRQWRKTAGSHCILNIPIGLLDLPGSRENILASNRNCDLILQTFFDAVAEMTSRYHDVLNSPTTRIDQKIDIATEWSIHEFAIDGKKYYTGDLRGKYSLHWVEPKPNNRYATILKEAQYNIGDLFRSSSRIWDHLAVVVCNREHPLATVKRLLQADWNTTSIDLLGRKVVIVRSTADYDKLVAGNAFFALLVANAPLLIDPGPKAASPKTASSAIDRKHRNNLGAAFSANEIFRADSLKAVGERAVNGSRRVPLDDLTICGNFPVTGPIVYLVDNSTDASSGAIYAYGILAFKLGIDTPVYICSSKAAAALEHFHVEESVEIGDFLDKSAQAWVTRYFKTIQEIGFAPGIWLDTSRSSVFALSRFHHKSSSIAAAIDLIRSDESIRKIASDRQLILLHQYTLDLDVWLILLECCGRLGLNHSNYELARLLSGLKQNSDGDNFIATMQWLLKPVLDRMPLLKHLAIRIDDRDNDDLIETLKAFADLV